MYEWPARVLNMSNQNKNVNLNHNEIGLSTIRMAKTRKAEDTMYCESQRLLSLSCIPVKTVNSIVWEKLLTLFFTHQSWRTNSGPTTQWERSLPLS